MRRHPTWKYLALLTVLTLLVAACGGGDGSDTTAGGGTEAPTDTTEPATDTTEPMTDTTAGGEASGDPIRIGGTLALTGFLAPTAAIHQAVGDVFVERINEQGGLLGRPVEWVLLDDESAPDTSAALYERLITEDEVDLVIGPYGTGNITAAMAVAERYGYVFPHHTASLTYAYNYACHFSSWSTGLHPNITNPNLVYDAIESSGNTPETIGFVINEFPGTMFIAYGQDGTDEGGAVTEAEKRGYDVVLDIQFPTAITDWAPIADQVAAADPDFLYIGGLGVNAADLITAMNAIDYSPRGMFTQWDAPGPLLGTEGSEGIMSVTIFEQHPPFIDDPEVVEVATEINQALADAGIPFTDVETQAAASWTAWEYLQQAAEGAGSLDQQAMCDYLLDNGADTLFHGEIEFYPEEQNYYVDLSKIKQIQDGGWYVVYPAEFAAPDRSVVYPIE
ncbi:MAG TPA: ABC transporter substrate-binding protein [Acidimicrobiia bacterium]|nr:ABC transporter substrate-binding protein [Acidimicrobiia bacterium]